MTTHSKSEELEKELEMENNQVLAEEAVAESETVIPEEEDVTEEEEDFEDEGAEEVVQEIKKIKKESVSLENFNWDTYSNVPNVYSEGERSQMEAMYDKTLSSITENEIIDGTVIAMNKREVVINIGFKSEGVVSMNEFRYRPDLKVGDTVEVYVESSEDKKGQLILSHRTARSMRSWDRVNQALENDEVITGYIKCRTKGGMIVDVFGIEAFLPGSQIDVKPIRDYDVFVGKTTDFKIVKINHEFKNVVVSHKALIEAELEQQKAEIISKLEKGQVLEGTVKNITSYGVFIDLGGVDGLIHITDLSWGRVSHPEEVVELDQKLNVVILDFDDAKKRIALGLKQLTPHPWDALDPNLKVGDTVSGKVVVIADYGAFVEISPGVEGLIHVSEMSWSQHLRSAQEFLKVGDTIEAQVLTLDREDRKMSLGIKQLKADPWDQIDEKYSIGSKHVAKVRNFTNFGVFVEIEEGVDGLIHISDLSWTKKVKHPSEFTQIGEDIDVVVLEIDKENRRLSLGHKQLEENPWDVFESIFTVDSIHEGTVVEIFDKGAIIALPYGVEGFVTPKHLVKEDGTSAKLDEKLDFKVIEFNKSSKRIILSHSRVFEDLRKDTSVTSTGKQRSAGDETKMAAKKLKASLEKTTFGDISELAALKEEMEATEKKSRKKKAATSEEEAPAPVKAKKSDAPAEEVNEAPEEKVAEEEKPVEANDENVEGNADVPEKKSRKKAAPKSDKE
ncbi:MAG: 30S ribosomal protein S1 [Bacteroidales bacterium]|jgi:small subunit ribosomal protein S1|nr:30S ribosomal protein S1 [Bacteroidales bacterium]